MNYYAMANQDVSWTEIAASTDRGAKAAATRGGMTIVGRGSFETGIQRLYVLRSGRWISTEPRR